MALALSVKTLHDTFGPEKIIPSALVFGKSTRPYTKSQKKPERLKVEERAVSPTLARKKMNSIVTRIRLNRVLKRVLQRALHQIYKDSDQISFLRESIVNSGAGEWIDPFEVEEIDETAKLAYVRNTANSLAYPFNSTQVKPYHTPDNFAPLLVALVIEYFKWHL